MVNVIVSPEDFITVPIGSIASQKDEFVIVTVYWAEIVGVGRIIGVTTTITSPS